MFLDTRITWWGWMLRSSEILTSEDEGIRLFETLIYCGGDVSFQKTRIFIYLCIYGLFTDGEPE
jgi:hypothetical protein